MQYYVLQPTERVESAVAALKAGYDPEQRQGLNDMRDVMWPVAGLELVSTFSTASLAECGAIATCTLKTVNVDRHQRASIGEPTRIFAHEDELCDQPVRYDREGTSPQNRLIAACHTTSEELQQLVHEPEICRKEMEAARGSVLSQGWLSTILSHFDQNPEQRTFTRQELELALEREG